MAVGETERFQRRGEREKRLVALSSVLAAVFLTTMKTVVGLMTGSLGILSEAAHSALDLAAAGVTLFAVRLSGRPADREHTYGHGKIENLSALFETFLLLVTCLWIIYEAIQRLFFKSVAIEATVWSFVVMLVSILVDFSRSRALSRVARKYNSQALEADALHFSTDIWSSSVVIVGLGLVRLSEIVGAEWLVKADAVSALGVAGIVIYVSVQLGRRAVAALLDAVPAGLREEFLHALRVPGVLEVKRARIRRSGPDVFADVILTVPRDTPLERAHAIADQAEAAAGRVVFGADVVVHIEPVGGDQGGIVRTVQMIAARHGLGAHAVSVYEVDGQRALELHLEISDELSVDAAHEQATAFENDVAEALPGIGQIVTHLEPAGEGTACMQGARADVAVVERVLDDLAQSPGFHDLCFHQLGVRRVGERLFVSFHCAVDPSKPLSEAHAMTVEVERALRQRIPNLGRVVIHIEPPGS